MYIELDGDEIAITYIKDVVFNANRTDVETLRMKKVLGPKRVLGFQVFEKRISVSCSHHL